MSNESTETRFVAGDFISENAVRGVFSRRRRPPTTTTTDTTNGLPANPPTASRDTSLPTDGRRPLRRCSVAELISRAGARPARTA